MKETAQVTALVVDHGLFLPLAERLAQTYKRVLYWSPYEEGFSTIKKGCYGDGYPNIERCEDIWLAKDEIDLFIFPDIQHAGLQLELEAQGFPVWGSRAADSIELDREKFLRLLGQAGLEVPSHEVVVGLSALSDYLRDRENQFIKISRWRGDMETTHWRNWELDGNLMCQLGVKFGPLRELVRFLVFDAIETDLEIGGDTYCLNGEFPDLMLHGIEWKDKSYFAAVTKREEMPEQIRQTLEVFGPILGHYGYRNEFSVEVRVVEDRFYFIDPTCRGGMPSTGSQMMLWKNFPEIIWAGAHGVLMEPEPAAQYAMECVMTVKHQKDCWAVAGFPPELQEWVKPACCCKVDELYAFPPNDQQDEIGWLLAIGDSPRETLQAMQAHVAALPDGVCANVESLANVIKEIEQAEEEGIEFGKQDLPAPAEVIED